ncbi:MAG: archaeosortase/exosortase family protein [Nitrospiraceae bacterium]|nr:archaeosortase/exosortase family protein [Nitrospiraceae bacterium]
MQNQNDTPRLFSIDRRFILTFLFFLTAFFCLSQSPWGIFDWVKPFTAYLAYRFWSLFSIPAALSGTILTLYDFPMEITHECTALQYFAIYCAGVLPFRSHTRAYRLAGILTGFFVIMALNILRIGVLGMVGHYANNLFDLVHVYLLQGAFAVIVFATWFLWVNKSIPLTSAAARTVFSCILASIAAFGAIHLLIERYAVLIAATANALIGAVPSSLTVSAEGRIILFRTAAGTLHSDLTYDILNAVLLSVLFAANARSVRRATQAKRVATGFLLLSLQHLLTVLCSGIVFAWRGPDPAFLTKILWSARIFGMVAPLLIWMAAARLFPSKGSPHCQPA